MTHLDCITIMNEWHSVLLVACIYLYKNGAIVRLINRNNKWVDQLYFILNSTGKKCFRLYHTETNEQE
jgi:hypothetical protein